MASVRPHSFNLCVILSRNAGVERSDMTAFGNNSNSRSSIRGIDYHRIRQGDVVIFDEEVDGVTCRNWSDQRLAGVELENEILPCGWVVSEFEIAKLGVADDQVAVFRPTTL